MQKRYPQSPACFRFLPPVSPQSSLVLRTFWLALLVLAGSVPGRAGHPVLDSLLRQLDRVEDTARVNVLNELALYYKNQDPARTIAYARQAAQLSRQLHFEKGLAYAYNQMGGVHSGLNQYATAIAWFNKALGLYRKLGITKGQQAALINIGLVYHKQNLYPNAVEYYLRGLRLAEARGDEIRMANVLNHLGDVYAGQEDYPQALAYYRKSLLLRKKHFKQGRPVSQTLSSIGNVYLEQHAYAKSLPYFEQALRGLTQADQDMRAVCLANLGLAYGGGAGGGLGQYPKALAYLNQALRVQQQVSDPYATPSILEGLACVHYRTGELAKSEAYARQALALARQLENKSLSAELCQLLARIYAGQGKYGPAYDYHVRFVQARDSILNQEATRRLARLQAGYETQKKQVEIELLKRGRQQDALRRNAAGAGLLALLAVAGLVVSRQRLRIRKNRLLVAQSTEISEKNKLLEQQADVLGRQAAQLTRTNTQLAEQAAQLAQQTEKLRELDGAKSTFFANLSHEFRTPLTLILGNLHDKLEESRASDHPEAVLFERTRVKAMHRNAGRLLQLINQLLDLSKLESGKMELAPRPGDLAHFFRVLTGSFASLAEARSIAFGLQLPPEKLSYCYDADKLEKIFSNLLSNAFKFTPAGGTIALEVAPEGRGRVKVSVQDSGPGIPPEQLDAVFNRFYQGQTHYADGHGTGIGLALVKELVDLHGGQVYAESAPSPGTRFVVVLPLAAPPAATAECAAPQHATVAESPAVAAYFDVTGGADLPGERHAADGLLPAKEPAGGQATSSPLPVLLVVEDNEDLREYIRRHLQDKYRVLESENGRLGLRAALKHPPDLIITDLMMPEMDGIELSRQLKTDERTSHIPVIMLTALATRESMLKGLATGADAYLTKPFDAQELRLRVDNLVESRRRLQQKFSRELHIAPKDIAVSSLDEKLLEKILAVVEAHLDDTRFGPDAFAREVGVSRMQLHRKLTALTGMATGDFVRTMRLKRAAQLLEARAGNVKEIAWQVGFESVPYFSKCFKEHFGVTATEYQGRTAVAV
ncbi:MAG: tetratricopeptide repeat protein [Cytophagales bacterium]|nr:tetratricopeptide repeat protein [Cytophagales bacterium]